MLQRRSGMLGTSDRARRLAALRAGASAEGEAAASADVGRGTEASPANRSPRAARRPAVAESDSQPHRTQGKKPGRAAIGSSAPASTPPAVAAFRVVNGGPSNTRPESAPADHANSKKRKAAANPDELARQGAAIAALVSLFRSAGVQPSESFLSETTPMSMPRFKRLVSQMPKIAEIVNQFQSPDMQREVLQALIRAFESEDADADDERDGHGSHIGQDSRVGSGSGSQLGSSSHARSDNRATNGQRKKKSSAPAFLDDADAAALIGAEAGDDSSIHS